MKKKLLHAPLVILVVLLSIVISCDKAVETDNMSSKEDQTLASVKALYGSQEACGPSATVKVSAKSPFETKRVVIPNTTIFDTDFLSAGVGGMRGVGNGEITLPATFNKSTVTQAYLYWHGVTNSTTNVGNSIDVNSTEVNGINIGVSSSNCWPFANSQAYRADVTELVQYDGSGTYSLSGFGEMDPNGASLIVFYSDGNNGNNRDVVLFEGNDSNIAFAGIPGNDQAPADPQGWDVVLSGIDYTSGSANIQLHVGDGQTFADAALLVNATEIAPAGPIFQGESAPGGNLWDIKSYSVTSFLSPGTNSLNLTTGLNSDCLSLVAAIIDLPAGAAPPVETIKVSFDFKPGLCPSPLNCPEKGAVTAAILGNADFDVAKIDVSTIKLNGVSSTGEQIQDVATPFKGKLQDCNSCTTAGPDGIKDLKLQFDNQALVATLGTTTDKQCVNIKLTCKLLPEFGGTAITGEDYVLIKK